LTFLGELIIIIRVRNEKLGAKILKRYCGLLEEHKMETRRRPTFRPGTDEGIRADVIVVDGLSKFPKKLIIMEVGRRSEYLLRKTRNGAYILNK
jgi:hypothetical protein